MAYDITAPNTGTSLEALDANSLRKLWKRSVDVAEQETDFFQQFEGPREDSIIQTVTDTSKGAGQRISFSTLSGFYKEGKHAEELFEASTDYEVAKINSNTLFVDWMRNGTRWSQRMEEHLGLRNELANKFPVELGKWLGRKKNRAAWMAYREKGTANNTMVAGGKASVDALTSADSLSWNDIVNVKAFMKNRGASPAHMGKVGKNSVKGFCVAGTTTGLLDLKKDDQYLNVLDQAGPDSMLNIQFTGGYAPVDGNQIVEFQDIDHDGDGPVGSPVNPKIIIKDAITSGTTGFDITGGTGDSATNYTTDFPNHAFTFNASDVLAGASDDFYVVIVNPSTAPTDPGKIGFYKCVGNDGNKITVTERLAASASGIAATTVGGVTWNTGVWSGLHTDVHPANATCYLANSIGQTYGYTAFLGGCSMRRGYGKYRNQRMTDDKEGGFIQETYIASVFGQEPKIRVDGESVNYMMLQHAINYPGTPLPTVV